MRVKNKRIRIKPIHKITSKKLGNNELKSTFLMYFKSMEIQKYNQDKPLSPKEKLDAIIFLYDNLDEYEGNIQSIKDVVENTMNENTEGGCLYIAQERGNTLGAVVINKDSDGNALNYIATHKNHRRKGIGSQLVKQAFTDLDGDLSLELRETNYPKEFFKPFAFKQINHIELFEEV